MFLFIDNSNAYLFLGYIPESVALLIFGTSLIVLTIGVRWFFDGKEREEMKEKSGRIVKR